MFSNILDSISPYLLPVQIVCLILATILILMQNRGGTGLGSSFGGSNEVYLTRRGIEKWVVNFTVIALVLFVVLRILNLYI